MSFIEPLKKPIPLPDPEPENKIEDRRLWIGNLDPRVTEALLDVIVYDQDSEDSMFGSCQICAQKVNDCIQTSFSEPQLLMKWEKWEQSHGNRHAKAEKQGTVTQCLDAPFKKHTFIKRKQSTAFQKAKESCVTETGILQVDFAENFTIISQDEIQSAYFEGRPQVTLFRACMWTAIGTYAFAVVSDELSYDKFSVAGFLKLLLNEIKQLDPKVKGIKVFSDDAASQFKQKILMCNST